MNENNGTKSQKYAAAVAKATGRELTVNHDHQGVGELAVPTEIPSGYGAIITLPAADQIGKDLASGELEWAPRVLTLATGMLIEGILEGRGGDVEMEEVEGVGAVRQVKIKLVGTWVIRDPKSGLRASFLSARQLEDKLPPFVGGYVKIYVGEMKESRKGTRYRDFLVGGPRLPGGDTRSFARALPGTMIESPEALDDARAAANDRSES